MLSRIADSLYWMSRYVERAERSARVIDVQLHLALDQAPQLAPLGWICVLNGLQQGGLPAEISASARDATQALAFDQGSPASLISSVRRARENAKQIREELPWEMWVELNQLYLSLRQLDMGEAWQGEACRRLHEVQRTGRLFFSLADSLMERGQGWQFVRLGRFLERIVGLAWLLEAHFGIRGQSDRGDLAPEDFVAWSSLLRGCTAYEAYCRHYTVELRSSWILEFLLFNEQFPHTARFAACEIHEAVTAIGRLTGISPSAPLGRQAAELKRSLGSTTVDQLKTGGLSNYLQGLIRSCQQLHESLNEQYISYPPVPQHSIRTTES